MNPKLYNHDPHSTTRVIIRITIIAVSLLSATILLSLQYSFSANAQSSSKTNNTNATAAAPIGNVQQLSKTLGNNTKMLTNGTNIGNPNASKAASAQQKVTAGTPATGLPSNPTKGSSGGGGKPSGGTPSGSGY